MVRGYASIIILLLATSCASPAVTYKVYQKPVDPDFSGSTKFKLPTTVVAIDQNKDDKTRDATPYLVTPVPAEGDLLFSMTTSGTFVKTHLKSTFRANTMLLESLGTDIEDNRVKIIEQVGGLVTGLIGAGLLLGESPDITFPQTIDVAALHLDAVATRGSIGEAKGKLSNGWNYVAAFGPINASALTKDEVIARMSSGAQSIFFYPACRDMRLQFVDDRGRTIPTTLKVADPNFFETAALPDKGKIVFHQTCGVDVTTEASGKTGDIEVLSKLITQVKAVRDAHKARMKQGN